MCKKCKKRLGKGFSAMGQEAGLGNSKEGHRHECRRLNYFLVGFFLYFSQYCQKLSYTSSRIAMIFSFSALLRLGVILSLSLPGFSALRILR